MKPLLLSIADAAIALGASERHVERLIADGRLPSLKLGASRRVHVADLEAYAARLRPSRALHRGSGDQDPHRRHCERGWRWWGPPG